MTKEVSRWAREQLLQAREKKESQRQLLRAAITFRVEDLEAPPPTVIATPPAGSTATALNDVVRTGTTPVPFATYTSDVLPTPPDAGPATSQSTAASATHSQSHHHDVPTSWSTFVEGVQSLSTTSSLLSMQQLPTLTVKKPLRFKQPREKWRTQARRGLLWRYALDDEETAEDKCRAKEEALALLESPIPVTRHALRSFLTTSGPTSHLVTFPSTSGTTARKSPPST